MFEKINEASFPPGYYYAHIPTLDLTTHGLGIEGAKEAAKDLIKLWLEEKREAKEIVKTEEEFLISTVEV
jgi:predicted RNase H-like HicB family nuclease